MASAKVSGLLLSKPSGLLTGDVMIAAVAARTERTMTVTGWTKFAEPMSGGTNAVSCAAFWKVAAAGDPASWTVNQSPGGAASIRTVVMGYRGVDRQTPIETYSTGAGHGSPITWPSVTVAASRLVVGVTGGIWDPGHDPVSNTSPAVTGRWDGPFVSSGNVAGYGFEDPVAAGATGAYVFTLDLPRVTDGWACVLMGLRPQARWWLGVTGWS